MFPVDSGDGELRRRGVGVSLRSRVLGEGRVWGCTVEGRGVVDNGRYGSISAHDVGEL